MTQLVGILNITPDSFSDGGQFVDPDAALTHARELIKNGASIIDIGAQSTNPSSQQLDIDTEWQRLEPILQALAPEKFQLSIDTFYPEIIRRSLNYAPDLIINDVTTAHDPAMRQLVVESGLSIFLSHLPFSVDDDIRAAHQLTAPIDDVSTVRDELLARRDELIELGASPEQIILDPGIGFGKTMRLNAELIDFAREVPGIPVMIGFSRKRFIEQYLHLDRFSPEVNASLAHQAIASGAAFLRLHEVAIDQLS